MSNLPGFYKFYNLLSPPTIPTLYWDAYTHEERIKKIIEKIHAIIEYLDLITDLINQIEMKDFTEDIANLWLEINQIWNRIQYLENEILSLWQSLDDIENRLDNIESELIDIRNIIEEIEIPDLSEILNSIDNLWTSLNNKQDKVPIAIENSLAVWNNQGNTKESSFNTTSGEYPAIKVGDNIITRTLIEVDLEENGKEFSLLHPEQLIYFPEEEE